MPDSIHKPVAVIRKQTLTTPPFTGDSTLVDDTVALVDDPVALSGGPTTIIPRIPSNARVHRTYTKVKKRR